LSIYDQALDLGKEIARTEAYSNMQKSEQALLVDADARKAVQDFQNMQQSYYQKRMQGQELSEEDMNRLKDVEDKAMSFSPVKEYYEARMQFHDVVEKVNAKIQEGMTGKCQDHSCGGG